MQINFDKTMLLCKPSLVGLGAIHESCERKDNRTRSKNEPSNF